jgi:hypothetical protein
VQQQVTGRRFQNLQSGGGGQHHVQYFAPPQYPGRHRFLASTPSCSSPALGQGFRPALGMGHVMVDAANVILDHVSPPPPPQARASTLSHYKPVCDSSVREGRRGRGLVGSIPPCHYFSIYTLDHVLATSHLNLTRHTYVCTTYWMY